MTVQRMGDSALRPGLDLGPQRLGQAVDPEQIRLEMTLGGQRPEQVCDGARMVRAVFHTDLVTHPELSLLHHPEIWSRSLVQRDPLPIGRPSCRERGCQYV